MRLEGTSTRVPVLGFRPTRGCLCRVRKLPNPRISILSPERRERTMLSKMASTITSESLRVISTTRETSSINSAFVMCALSPFRLGLPAFTLHSDIHYFFEGHCCCRGVALIILQPGSFLVIGQRANAQTDFLFGFIQLYDLKIHLFADRQWRFVGPPVGRTRNLRAMAQAFHTRSQFHERPEIDRPAHAAAHHVANLMSAEERLPRIRLKLL